MLRRLSVILLALSFSMLFGCGSANISGTVTEGTVGLGGITVTLSGAGSGTTTTNPSGLYTFASLSSLGNHVITPSHDDYIFAPVSQNANITSADMRIGGMDFEATVVVHGECSDGDYEPCYTGPDGSRGIGECLDGVRSCLFDDYWGPCRWEVTPVTETCDDSLDNDCDGEIDTDCIPCIDNDEDGYGDPVVDLCEHREVDCDNDDETIYPGATEILDDGIDQDCDGRDSSVNRFTDEGNGTVYDWNSGLIWLQNGNAFGQRNWLAAKAEAAALDEGDFAWLTDGSSEGDWRLATKYESFPVSTAGGYDLFYDVQALYWTGQDCLDIGLYTWAYLRLWGELKANAMTWNADVWPVREDN